MRLGKRSADDLVHVVVTVFRQAPDERHAFGVLCKSLVALVKAFVFLPWNWIIGVTVAARKLPHKRRSAVLLAGQVPELRNPRVVVLVGIVDCPALLQERSIAQAKVLEPQRSVWQRTEPVPKVCIDGPSIDEVIILGDAATMEIA